MQNLVYRLRNVDFSYLLGSQKVQALWKVSLEIVANEFVCLAGPSGSGKSTLLNILGLIEPIQDGQAQFEGTDLKKLSETEKNKLRRHKLGFIFQNFHLMEALSAYENIEYFLSRQGIASAERRSRVEEALEHMGLKDHRDKKPSQMSGGQRQRVAIARALAKKPTVIIADEPTASLDQKTGREIMELLNHVRKRQDVTVVMCSHDPMAIGFAERIIKMTDGQINT